MERYELFDAFDNVVWDALKAIEDVYKRQDKYATDVVGNLYKVKKNTLKFEFD